MKKVFVGLLILCFAVALFALNATSYVSSNQDTQTAGAASDLHEATAGKYFNHIYVWNDNGAGGAAIYVRLGNGLAASDLTAANQDAYAIRIEAQTGIDKDFICDSVCVISDSGASTYDFTGYIY